MSCNTLAPPRGHGEDRRDIAKANAVDWSQLVRHGNIAAMASESGVASQGGEPCGRVDTLAQEVEDLIERQPQFAFLKPCRQLEKHYSNKRNSISGGDSSSFRYGPASAEVKGTKTKNRERMQTAGSSGTFEDAHPKPGTSTGTIRELLSCDGIELNGFTVDGKSGIQGTSSTARVVTKEYHDAAQARRHGRGHFHRNSGERIWRISSTRCSIHEKEAHIDLLNPAAAKFLMEMSPGANASPPAVAVPFKWEDAPGRAKAHAEAASHPTLQLPPRLAPVPRSDAAFSQQLRVSVISHPLAGLFPCVGANSPSPSPLEVQPQRQSQRQPQQQQQQQQDHITWMHYRASNSYGGVYQNPRKHSKSFSQPLVSTDQSSSVGLKPRRLFSSELGSSRVLSSTDPTSASSSSSSILHGSRQSSSSRTYLSCELGTSTPRTAGSKSCSSASYDSIGEDFDHDDSSVSPHSAGVAPAPQSRRHRRSEPKGLLKLCKSHGNCLRKSKSRRRICSPEVWAPTLATYFQRLDVNEEPLLEKHAAAPTSSGYLNSKGEPQPLHSAPATALTSSGYLNCKGEPVPLRSDQAAAPTSSGYLNTKGEPVPLPSAEAGNDGRISSPELSPRRPTRLPYKMPSVAEQVRGRGRSDRHRSSLSKDLQCPSPAYAAALELLSPAAVTLMTSRRHQRNGVSRTVPSPKPHRRVQFILSMCKTLKRVLFRQQPRRSVVGTRLMYHDERAPTTFQFSKPN